MKVQKLPEANSLPYRSSQLDLLRTIAILLVFTSHFILFSGSDWFKPIGKFGWIGVDLFFTLSGFLITSQLLKALLSGTSISLKDFYLRRGLRIWPSFFFVLALYLAIPEFAERKTLPPLWRFFTFTQNFGLDFVEHGAFSHAWSLCVEEQFYLLLPFILMLLFRFGSFKKSIVLLCCLIFGGIGLRYSLWEHYVAPFYYSSSRNGIYVPFYREIYYPTYCRLDGFAIGVSIASIYRLRPALWKKICTYSDWIFGLAGLSLGVALFLVRDQKSVLAATFGVSLVDLSFGCFVIAALSPRGVFSRIRLPGTQTGATLAFAFYLTQKQIINLSRSWLPRYGIETTSILYPAGIFSLCIFSAFILYLFIEKPFLLLRDRMLRKRRGL
jgi:peptidoglycan/LPS O-acetylase OafA/YrhL